MNRATYPSITQYRHHLMAILLSETDAELTAVGNSINATVPTGHTEYTYLVQAGKERREEIKLEAENKEVKE